MVGDLKNPQLQETKLARSARSSYALSNEILSDPISVPPKVHRRESLSTDVYDDVPQQQPEQHGQPSEAMSAPGQPQEQFQIDDSAQTDEIVYPSGIKLVMAVVSILLTMFLSGLDLTIVAPAIPSLTNHFKTLEDIGWYSSAYGIIYAAFVFTYGKLYTLFLVKHVFLAAIFIFEAGSLLCTVAPTSTAFIVGRALAGLGASGIAAGTIVVIAMCFPTQKRPIWTACAGAAQSVGLISAPVIGGALIDGLSWRACFGINLPLGVVVFTMIAYAFKDPVTNPDTQLPLKEKMKKVDFVGTLFMVPAITCLLLAMQWGGARFGWGNARIIVLMVLFVTLVAAFAYLQHRLQERATLPPRIFKQRSVLAAAWFGACTNGSLAVTEYYISIYFQGVKNYPASRAGMFILPMLICLAVSGILSGIGTSMAGYYAPFMIAASVLAPVASGLLTTIELDDNLVKPLCFLGFLGFAIGLGIQGPFNAVQTVMSTKDLPIAVAVISFGGGIGSSLFVAASAALFQNRLITEIGETSPGTNATQLAHVGLTEIRQIVGDDRLRAVLFGFDKAVTQTLYMPVALTVASIIGSLAIEWRSVKAKKE